MCQFVGDYYLIAAGSIDDEIAQSSHSLMFHGRKSTHIHSGIAIFFKGIVAKKTGKVVDHIR